MSAITFLAFIIYDWRGRYPLPRLLGRNAATTTAAAAYTVTPSPPHRRRPRGHFMIQGMGMLPAEWRGAAGILRRNDYLCTWRFAKGQMSRCAGLPYPVLILNFRSRMSHVHFKVPFHCQMGYNEVHTCSNIARTSGHTL